MQPEATTDRGMKMIPTTDPINSEKQGARKEPAKPATKKKEPRRQGTGCHAGGARLATELRNHNNSIEALAEAFPFIKPETDKLLKQVNRLIDRVRLFESQTTQDDEFIRIFIMTKCGGARIEKWIRELPENGENGAEIHDNIRAKEKFRAKGWRT